jgi:hypothetical protein
MTHQQLTARFPTALANGQRITDSIGVRRKVGA